MIVRRRLLFLLSFGLPSSTWGAILQGMRDLRYVEGRNFVVEWRFAAGNYDRFAEFVAEFVRMNVDVIFPTRERLPAGLPLEPLTSSHSIALRRGSWHQ